MQRDTSPHVQHDHRQMQPSYNTNGHNQADTAQSIPCLVQLPSPRPRSFRAIVGLVCRSCRQCPIWSTLVSSIVKAGRGEYLCEITYHINKNIQWTTRPLLQQFSGIVLLPLCLVIAKVPIKRLLAPETVDRVGDRRESGDGLVLSWVAEELFGHYQQALLKHTQANSHLEGNGRDFFTMNAQSGDDDMKYIPR